jgi:hypothetical protein
MPKNLKQLTERLPKSNYENCRQKSQECKKRNQLSLRISKKGREDGSCFSTDSSEKETAEKDKKN